MKRKLTLLLLGLAPCLLSAQSPVGVYGPMNVSSGGNLLSQGTVTVNANSSQGTGVIYNKGTITLQKGVSFYSNDASSAVLLNDYDNGGTVQLTASAGEVSLHKLFLPGGWYYISLPFNVKLSDLKDAQGNTVPYDSFRVRYYDAQNRASNGSTSGASANWKSYTAADYATVSLNANQGYIVMVNPSFTQGLEVTFPATVDAKLNALYSGNKSIAMNNPKGASLLEDQGWNYLGNPHTANFNMSNTTTGYPATVYYWSTAISNYDFADLEAESLTVRSFTPVFMQAAGEGQSFLFKNTGLTLSAANPGLRSTTSSFSFFKLGLNGTGSYSDACNISLGDSYTGDFRIMEDGVKMFSPVEEAAQLWSVSNDGKALCVNKLSEKGTSIIPLGVSLGIEDDYTISLKSNPGDFEQVMLIDKETSSSTDLLTDSYTFHSGVFSSTDRFYISISRVPTGIDRVSSDGKVLIYAQDGMLKVDNIAAGDNISVYDVSGRMVFSGYSTAESYSASVSVKGVLLVKVSGTSNASAKIIVR